MNTAVPSRKDVAIQLKVIASSENSRPMEGNATPTEAAIKGVKNELSVATSNAAFLPVCVPAGISGPLVFILFIITLSHFLCPVTCFPSLIKEEFFLQYNVDCKLATLNTGSLTRYDSACYTSIMPSVTSETFDTLTDYWFASTGNLYWNSPFILPAWLKVWWQNFGVDNELHLISVRDSEQVIGVAPLQLKGDTASIVGGENVCDYLDFIVTPGKENEFFHILLDDLQKKKNIRKLDLGLVRPDSLVISRLADIARNRGMAVKIQQVDVSYEMDLLSTWDGYLDTLNTKQRHEVRRKLRRLNEAGDARYRLLKDRTEIENSFVYFMQLFSLAREDKASFMTSQMASFFYSLAAATAEIGILRIGMLEFKGQPVAAVMCFDYNNRLYLYNSGFNPEYESLSVGLNSKVLCIRESIEERKNRFEFLKGNEVYKQRLGGKEIPLYRCEIKFE